METIPNQPKNKGCSAVLVGNPCNPGTGNKFQYETDYLGTGEQPLSVQRAYNSAEPVIGAMGYGWTMTYERRIRFNSTTGLFAAVFREDGKVLVFRNISGQWTPDGDVTGKLYQLSTSGWRYITESDDIEIYDADGKLLSLTKRNGLTQTFSYSDASTPNGIAHEPGLLIRVTDVSGRQLLFAYDASNHIVGFTDPNGDFYAYGYDANNNLVSVTYPDDTPDNSLDNPRRIYHYEIPNIPHALTGITDENGDRFATWTYDAQGRVVSSEHVGGTDRTTLAFSQDGSNIIKDALGKTSHYSFETLLGVVRPTRLEESCPNCEGRSQTFAYDANGNITSRTDFNGNLSCYAYDLSRNLETVRLEGLASGSSCPADLANYVPTTGGERKISTQWHASYRLPSQIDETGRRNSFSYDANGNLLQTTVTDTVTQQSRSWAYTYNSIGQVLTEDGPRSDVNDATRSSYYSDSTTDHKPSDLWKITNALGHVTTFNAYDANGRLLRLTNPNGLIISFDYDARGRLTQKTVDGNTTHYDYDPTGNLIKVTRPSGVFINYTYDAAHRLTDITDALGGKIHYTLDLMGNRVKEEIFDAAGTLVKTQSRQFDALSRLQQDIGAYNQITNYQYDANGNLTQIIDANYHATQFAYDRLNRLIRTTDALAGLTDYQYDSQDRITQVTDAKLHSTVFSYNGLGDLTQLDSPNTGITRYNYDSAGNLVKKTDAGNVAANYNYDALNRPLGVDYPGTEADTSYKYDTTHDSQAGQIGRLTEARRGDIVTLLQYDLRGNQTANTVQNSASNRILSDTHYDYDAGDRLSKIRITPTSHIHYHYDIADQIQRIDLVDANGTPPLWPTPSATCLLGRCNFCITATGLICSAITTMTIA